MEQYSFTHLVFSELIDLAATAVTDTGTMRASSVRSNPETQAQFATFNSGLSAL